MPSDIVQVALFGDRRGGIALRTRDIYLMPAPVIRLATPRFGDGYQSTLHPDELERACL
jgi:hypothetical protein